MRRLFGLLVGFGPIVALAGTRASSEHVAHRAGNSAGHLDAFVVAHQDDWQLFGRGSSPAQAISALFSRTYVRPAVLRAALHDAVDLLLCLTSPEPVP